ncbi:hypothetical protein ESA94_16280 [Lacibacter luteus]|uniref:DUF1682 domain-containing protein n=1 Tax=Lacibacter luteus TaxID=2508719 RepID=A0A4Q1CFX9_9BACT|nr:hypothetical protein [Lacibacter luteus]RXK58942.1 hypothetical protein ESA94_16280 [Lacibacter luteus]
MMRNRNKKWMAFIPLLIVAGIALFGWLVMYLWNVALVPAVNGVNAIGFWQALGILLLSKILFSSFSGKKHKGDHAWKKKWSTMSDEERTRFRQEWWKRCGKMPEETNVPKDTTQQGE